MPISLCIGLSRKVSKDYNSRGYSVNLDVELPADAINDQQSIADSADQLFALCDQLLDRQIAGQQSERVEQQQGRSTNGYPRRGGGRPSTANGNGRSMTNAQTRAIESMTRKLGEDPNEWARHEFGQEFNQLNIRQASEMIDSLKQAIESREKVER
ncbi:MAG: hypothetical protein AAGC72_03830 [Planctomycetota bacterium]